MNSHLSKFSCGMFIKDLDGIYVWASDYLLERHNLKSVDILGKGDRNLPWARYAKTLSFHDQSVLALKRPAVFNETISRMGQSIKGFCHKSPYFDKEGRVIGIAGVFFDAPQRENTHISSLSIRERQCLKNLIKGMTALESASDLGLSRRTVEGYLEQIRLKLHCKNQAELIVRYFEEVL